jgi:hypothetical protein
MFRGTMGPSLGDTIVWYAGAYAPAYQTVTHTE